MIYLDLETNKIIENEKENLGLKFLYNTFLGRLILKLLTMKWVSELYAKFLNSKFSVHKIKNFVKKNNIDLSEYEEKEYSSFNDFFMRNIKKDKRKLEDGLISICDSKLSVYEVKDGLSFNIKNSKYTIDELIKEDSKKYNFKYALVFRLCVDDYHHYIFPDNGKLISSKYINGVLHTVRPIALKKNKVFLENSRNVSILDCENLGTVGYIEVGALMVGKIVNENKVEFLRGEEKGHFEFGGSTIILLLQDKVEINKVFIENTKNNIETIIKLGNRLN